MTTFVFRVLPFLEDSIQGLGLMCACAVIPSFLKIMNRPPTENLGGLQIILDVIAFLAQVSGMIALPVIKHTSNHASDLKWAILLFKLTKLDVKPPSLEYLST